MATQSTIEWTESTWNPLAGCTKISASRNGVFVPPRDTSLAIAPANTRYWSSASPQARNRAGRRMTRGNLKHLNPTQSSICEAHL